MNRLFALLPLLLVLGCSSSAPAKKTTAPGATGTEEPERARPTGTRKKGGDEEKKKDTNVYAAKITDKSTAGAAKTKPFTLEGAVLFVPEVSLFGGSSGNEKKVLELRRGASTTIEIPFHRIDQIQVGKQREDRLALKVALNKTKPEDKWLEGTVKSSLQLKGTFAGKNLTASVKLREVATIDLSVLRKK